MKFFTLASLSLVASLSITGCASGESAQKVETPITKKLSRVEACRELLRLVGKTTDQLQGSNVSLGLSEIAREFNDLAEKTDDQSLKEAFRRFSDSLKKMSNESTFFEGQMTYLNELGSMVSECS